MIRKSLYTYQFEFNGAFYVYNSQTGFFSEISKGLYDIISDREWNKLPSEVMNDLLSKQLIMDESKLFDYFKESKIRFLSACYDKRQLNLIIAPTTNCNFKCPYCFEPKKRPKTISDATVSKLIEFISSHEEAEKLSITWYGGEPLMAFDKMKSIMRKIKDNTDIQIISHSIVTNGYLISDDVIDFFREYKLNKIQVTLDGTKDHHDNTRFTKVGHKTTFDVITRNIENLSSKLKNVRISIRVNINKENFEDFVDIYKYYNSCYENVYVYPGIIREDTSDGCSLCNSSYKSHEILNLYCKLRSMGVDIEMFPLKLEKGCMINRVNSFIIGPEGELYKCFNDVSRPEKIVGSIYKDRLTNTTLYVRYTNDIIPFDEECQKCSVFPICSGGCGFSRYRNMYEGAEYEYCSVFKYNDNLKKALLQYKESGVNKNVKRLRII